MTSILTVFAVYVLIGFLIFKYGFINRNSNNILPVKRIDLDAARRVVEKVEFPEILRNYKFNDVSTGIFDDWNKSHLSLGDMCVTITRGLKYAQHAASDSSDAALAIAVAEDFMIRYKNELAKHSSVNIPWGGNWYQFSVSSTSMAAYYLLLPNVKSTELAADLILRLIQTPRKSLGLTRDGINTVYFAGPYLLAKYFKGQVDEVWDMPEYQYVLDYLKFNVQEKQGADGLHIDKTFVFHSGSVAFAYLRTLISDLTTYYYELDSFIVQSPQSIWYSVRDIICHPTIAVSAMGVYGRAEDLAMETNESSPLGIKVIPFARYIRYFTDKHQFSMRLMVPWYGFFESDPTIYTQSQYWTQYRNVHTAKSSKSIQFPDVGFICRDNVKALIPIKTQTNVTTLFRPKFADSFVLSYDRYGIGWQTYNIEQYGSQTITELVVIDSKTNVITVNIIVELRDTETYFYYNVDELCSLDEYRSKVRPFLVLSGKVYTTYFDLNANTVATMTKPNAELLPLSLEDGIKVEVENNIAVLRKNGRALVICPKNQPQESSIINLDGVGTFKFDNVANQYTIDD